MTRQRKPELRPDWGCTGPERGGRCWTDCRGETTVRGPVKRTRPTTPTAAAAAAAANLKRKCTIYSLVWRWNSGFCELVACRKGNRVQLGAFTTLPVSKELHFLSLKEMTVIPTQHFNPFFFFFCSPRKLNNTWLKIRNNKCPLPTPSRWLTSRPKCETVLASTAF